MALVTVQRSPSPSDTPDSLASDHVDGIPDLESSTKSPRRSQRYHQTRKRFRKCLTGIRFVSRLRLSESYVSFKGAALILPQSECLRTVTKGTNVDIHAHLQSMFCLLRPQDTIKMAIKLDSVEQAWVRYMAVVTTTGVQDTEESVIVGVDISDSGATIGLVLPVWADTSVRLNGDGGFHITSDHVQYIFKPVSVQAMWSAWQSLNKLLDTASHCGYYAHGLTHTWVQFYAVTSSQPQINLWNLMEDLESARPDNIRNTEQEDLELIVRNKLREVMMKVDLEEVTSKLVRTKLEEELGMSLQQHKHFVDQEMIVILRQMDAPSQIFDYLYLGSEWNASNLDELQKNGIGYILNMTREIDNFFPGIFRYKNVRVYDVDESDLLRHWEETYKFINKARKSKSKVLVHCKMGVSRSASTVISFAMKYRGWSLDEAFSYVKSKRAVVHPNAGFMKQLKTYEGILGASNQRHNKLWRSSSVGEMMAGAADGQAANVQHSQGYKDPDELQDQRTASHTQALPRPQSWSPHDLDDNMADLLLKATDLAPADSSDADSLDGELESDDSEPMHVLLEGDTGPGGWELSSEEQELGPGAWEAGGRVVLVGHRPREDSLSSEDCVTNSDSEEDIETPVVEAGYSIEVLDSAQNSFLYERTDSDSSSMLHHPDVIVEWVLANHRQQATMSCLQNLHQKREPDNRATVVHASPKCTAPARVKADDSWIREDGSEDTSNISIDPDPEPSVVRPASDSSSDQAVDSSPEGSIKPYVKEAIPWSPGTVRRHAQDLECRLTTIEVPLSETPPPGTRRSESTQDTITSLVSTPPQSQWTLASPTTTLPQDVHCVSPRHQSETESNSTMSTPLDSPSLSPPRRRTASPGRDPLPEDIYQSEDIPLIPGHVLRTKFEMEQRERSRSFLEQCPDKEMRPVQRSSSYKGTTRERFDRSDDRRRTCLPILHLRPVDTTQSTSLPDLNTVTDRTDTHKSDCEPVNCDQSSSSTEQSPIVLDEGEVLIRHGSVRRTKQEMEQKFGIPADQTKKTGNDQVPQTEAPPGGGSDREVESAPIAVPVPSVEVRVELETDVMPRRRLRHSRSSPQLCPGVPAYPAEEDITWSVGTVRQHTQAFESISDTALTSLSRLNTEILRLIREVGTAWSMSPKTSVTTLSSPDTGPGLVRRLADQIEGQSASRHIQHRLLQLQSRQRESTQSQGPHSVSKSLPRSASLRETSPRHQELHPVVIRSAPLCSPPGGATRRRRICRSVSLRDKSGKQVSEPLRSTHASATHQSAATDKGSRLEEQRSSDKVPKSQNTESGLNIKLESTTVTVCQDGDSKADNVRSDDDNSALTLEHESSVKTLRDKFEVADRSKLVSEQKSRYKHRTRDVDWSERRRRSKSSPESLVQRVETTQRTATDPTPIPQPEITEVLQIVQCIEGSEPLLDPDIRNKAIQCLFNEHIDSTSGDSSHHGSSITSHGDSRRHRYSRSMSSVPTVHVAVMTTPPANQICPRDSVTSPPYPHPTSPPDPGPDTRPVRERKLHGKSHPLTKLSLQSTSSDRDSPINVS